MVTDQLKIKDIREPKKQHTCQKMFIYYMVVMSFDKYL